MTAITKTAEAKIARPLTVLAGLIVKDIQMAKEAEQSAGLPYYKAAGEKLMEAKSQLSHGEFEAWVKRNFQINNSTAWRWMKVAEGSQNGNPARMQDLSQADFIRQTTGNDNYNRRPTKQTWHDPVKQIVKQIDTSYLERQRQKQLDDAKEYKLERDLALKIIDIGYKTLATKLHPDKGGSTEAMQRLQRAVKRLKGAI